jgi:hypothetical protein
VCGSNDGPPGVDGGSTSKSPIACAAIAAFSSANSAYIRFSFAFSASSSFSRFSSSTEAPVYCDRHWKYVALLMLCCRTISAIGTPALALLEDGDDLALR